MLGARWRKLGRCGRLVSVIATGLVACGLLGPAAPLASSQSTVSGTAAAAPPSGGTAPPNGKKVHPCSNAKLHLRCPDIVMSAPFDVHVDRVSIRGHVLLRAASSVNNHGSGPLEVRAFRHGPGPFTVEQAIYDRRGRAHLFPTAGSIVFKFVSGYRFHHPTIGNFSYWKFRQVAAFQLWSIDSHFRTQRLVRIGPKVDYCLRDLLHSAPGPRSPAGAVYPACSTDPSLQRDVLGTSVGWSDVYPYEYPQQWIDVTGLRGRFAFVMIADPHDVLRESNKKNDASETFVALPSGRVLGQRVGVPRPRATAVPPTVPTSTKR